MPAKYTLGHIPPFRIYDIIIPSAWLIFISQIRANRIQCIPEQLKSGGPTGKRRCPFYRGKSRAATVKNLWITISRVIYRLPVKYLNINRIIFLELNFNIMNIIATFNFNIMNIIFFFVEKNNWNYERLKWFLIANRE